MPLSTHRISLSEAAQLTRNYRNIAPNRLAQFMKPFIAEMFEGDAIQEVLDQNGCVGIRNYYGAHINFPIVQFCLVVVGVDSQDRDLYNGIILQHAHICPPRCGTPNPLNS